MKKITLMIAFVAFAFSAQAQNQIYFDDFNDEDISDWTLYDEDGDGLNWSAVQITDADGNPVETPVLRSASWNSQVGALTPDNYAVTPAIELPTINDDETITLNWKVAAADADWTDENYTVYVATSNTVADLNSSDVSFNELVSDNGPGGLENFYDKSLDVTSFAGSTIYVAFRHHNSTDQFTMEIDDVEVETDSDLSNNDFDNKQFSFFYNDGQLGLEASETIDNVSIFNMLGQEMLNTELSNSNGDINVSSFNNGMYITKVTIGDKTETFKFIKK